MSDALALNETEQIEEWLGLIREGTPPELAGYEVGWLPAKTRRYMADPSIAELVESAGDLAVDGIERVLFAKGMAGNMTAIQLILFNRRPERWRDVKRVEINGNLRITADEAASQAAIVLEMLRNGDISALQPGGALDQLGSPIIDAEVIGDGGEGG